MGHVSSFEIPQSPHYRANSLTMLVSPCWPYNNVDCTGSPSARQVIRCNCKQVLTEHLPCIRQCSKHFCLILFSQLFFLISVYR